MLVYHRMEIGCQGLEDTTGVDCVTMSSVNLRRSTQKYLPTLKLVLLSSIIYSQKGRGGTLC